jgi:hypothetical protein
MPAGVVETKRDERLWSQAKTQVSQEYPDIDADSDRYWKLVNGIYQRMKHHTGGAAKSLFLRVNRLSK